MRPLVLCAHGTADPAGQQVVLDVLDRVRDRLPGGQVEAAYVDVQQPTIDEVVPQVYDAAQPPVVVPLLLSTGFHVEVDIDRAVRAHPGTDAAPALGPSELLAEVVLSRVREAGVGPGEAVVFAAAGSSRERAIADSERAARLFADRWDGLVRIGYGSAGTPSVPEAVASLRAAGAARVAIAAYLIGPGHFHTQLHEAGADVVSAPIGADDRLVEQVLQRYAAATGAC